MAYLNFTDALMAAKRRAQLSGRPISQQEVQGIAQGFASSAAEKNIQEKSVGIQEKAQAAQETQHASTLEESKKQFTETLAQRKYETERELDAASHAQAVQQRKSTGAAVGTVAGGVIGGVIGAYGGFGIGAYPGWAVGAAAGGIVGGMAGSAFGCIIISSCTSPDSYEVNIAREYRDKFMNFETLTGYYSLCIYIVPLIQKYPRFKRIVKKVLVDRLVDYGECCLGYKEKRKYLTSGLIKGSFLGLCRIIGKGVNAFVEVENG